MGSYHGKKSFETFSHRRSCLVRPLKDDEDIKVRYPPSTNKVRSGDECCREPARRTQQGLTVSDLLTEGSPLKSLLCPR